MIFCNGESGRVNFCLGELILELLARIGEWHQNLSEKTARKHLTKRQKDTFIQYGFSKALLREVIAAGLEQEEKIGLIMPLNPKGTSMGEPPEPNLGMIPPGLRRTTRGGSKPALNPGQRMGSLKAIQEELRKTIAKEKAEECAAQAAKAAKAARKSGVKAPKGGVKKPHRF